uniref:efflux RND transporter permease subunit n=1 Tax=Roseobacter sp. TaxID=1907202 RepID=UPI0025E73087
MGTLTFRQPRIVALILLVIIAAGASALLAIGRQEDPTITNLFATVTTPWPGADPARVESLVTAEIEDSLREVSEVDVLNSTSAAGISIVQIELIETLAADRIEEVWSELRDKLSVAQDRFPAGVLPADLDTDGAGAYGAIVALSTRHDGVPLSLTGRFGKDIADRLRNVQGTRLVELFGVPEEEITVTLNAQRAAGTGLTPDAVAAAIARSDAKVSAGRLSGAGDDLLLEVSGEITSPDRLRNIVLRDGPDGQTLLLGSVAQITRGPRQPVAEAALHNGRPAVLIAARAEDGLQVDVWAAGIRAVLDDYQPGVPAGMQMELVFDQSTYTAARLAEVAGNMAVGVGLVLTVLLITLGLRAAMIVAMVLPVVTLATLFTMNLIALPVHQMSVTGLIVALGLLVDAGIVMTDEIARRIRSGASRHDAVRGSVSRLTMPLFASTVTTALSFTPMILLPGPAGDFVGSIALAVVIMLGWSFVVAVTITPAMAGWLMPAEGRTGVIASGISSGFAGRLFARSLLWSLRNPVRSVLLALVLPVLGFASLPLLTAQFFPGVDRDQFHIEVDMPPGTGIGRTQAAVTRLDAHLRTLDEVVAVSWTTGRSAPAFYYNIPGGRKAAPGYAQALVRTRSAEATETVLPELQRDLPALAPDAQVLVRGLVQGPPVNAPVELRLIGQDLALLREAGDALRRIIEEVPTVTLARSSLTPGAPGLAIDVDEARARLVGLTPGDIARQLDAALTGVTGGSLIEGSEELSVRVRFDADFRSDPARVRDLPLILPEAGAFPATPLSALADVMLVPRQGQITRRDGERVNTVQAYLQHGVLPEEALGDIRERIDNAGFELPGGVRLQTGGDSDARASTLNNLLASLGLIITLSVAVVVMTFGSFRLAGVALVVGGLSAGLSVLALAVFGYPFGINAIIGLIGSVGVSINAALIIMTALQEDDAA